MPAHEVAAWVGYFHVPRHTDIALLRQALAQAPRCAVFVAGAHRPRSPRHPFDWQERAWLLRESLAPHERDRVSFHPLREGLDAARTTSELLQALPGGQRVLLATLPGTPALAPVPGWDLAPAARPGAAQAGHGADDDGADRTRPGADRLRDLLLAAPDPGAALAQLAPLVPDTVLRFLRERIGGPEWQRLREEYAQIAGEKAAWSVAPYPVVLVTVDAVLRAAGHVLLIRRARPPGKGLRALPGGFVDPRETVYEAAVRELAEETGFGLSQDALRAALRGVQVFDDPGRSQRGRVITHAHFFDFGGQGLPPVRGGDDAASAEWVPIGELPGLESQLLDDHFLILDHFLGLLPSGASA